MLLKDIAPIDVFELHKLLNTTEGFEVRGIALLFLGASGVGKTTTIQYLTPDCEIISSPESTKSIAISHVKLKKGFKTAEYTFVDTPSFFQESSSPE